MVQQCRQAGWWTLVGGPPLHHLTRAPAHLLALWLHRRDGGRLEGEWISRNKGEQRRQLLLPALLGKGGTAAHAPGSVSPKMCLPGSGRRGKHCLHAMALWAREPGQLAYLNRTRT